MTHQIHAVIARARPYARHIKEHGTACITHTVLRQMVLVIPELLAHIDAQAVMLGHPRNRKADDTGGHKMHGHSDTYDPPPPNGPPGGNGKHANGT